MSDDDVRAAAERLLDEVKSHLAEYDDGGQFTDDILAVASYALEAGQEAAPGWVALIDERDALRDENERMREWLEPLEAWASNVLGIVKDRQIPSSDVTEDGEAITEYARAALEGRQEATILARLRERHECCSCVARLRALRAELEWERHRGSCGQCGSHGSRPLCPRGNALFSAMVDAC